MNKEYIEQILIDEGFDLDDIKNLIDSYQDGDFQDELVFETWTNDNEKPNSISHDRFIKAVENNNEIISIKDKLGNEVFSSFIADERVIALVLDVNNEPILDENGNHLYKEIILRTKDEIIFGLKEMYTNIRVIEEIRKQLI